MTDHHRRDPLVGEDLADDLLKGAEAIARFIGQPIRQTYYLLENNDLPGFKMNGSWWSTRSSIRCRVKERLEASTRNSRRID